MGPYLKTVIACLLWAVMPGPAQSAIADGACGECHTGFTHRALAVKAGSDCVSCHSGGVQPPRPLFNARFPSGGINAQSPAGGIKVSLTTAAAAVTGMPPAGARAKVGTDPNPMVMIPAGEFLMGTDGRLPDEGPQHKVRLDSYWIDIYEVTNGQYKKFIDATKRRSPAHFRNRTYPDGKADHPVTEVTWYDADAYCTWAGKRLPSDQEWEKAARGTHGQMFPWGNEFDTNKANTPQRWAKLNMEGDTMPVGSFPDGISPYGLYEMSGNVWEWTASWYQAYPGNTHPSESYGEQYKTLKGGSWWDCSFYKCGISAPVFNRAFFLRGTHNKSFGFRCAKDAVGRAQGDGNNVARNAP